MLELLVISVIFVVFLTKLVSFFTKTNNNALPPFPPRLPILGNLHQLGTEPHRSLHSLARRHGPLMLLHLGSTPTLIVSSAEAAREIMKTHDIIFANRPYSSIARGLLYDGKDMSQLPYGDYWRQIRSICVLHLLSPRRVQSFRSVREAETALLLEKVEQSCLDSSPIDLSQLFIWLTNNVVCRVSFGRKYSEGDGGRRFKELLEEFGALLGVFDIGDFIPWLSWMKFVNGLNSSVVRVFREFDCFIDGIVDEHLACLDQNDAVREDQMNFVDTLLQLQRSSSDGAALDKDGIKAIILDMFAAGTDTTSTALEWTMTELLRHPEVMKKAQEEIRNITGNKPYAEESDIEKMVYLKAIIKETLRKHPPVPLLIPRESSEDVKLQGYEIPAKTRVFINAFAIGRDPKTWEEPEEFRPERFLGSGIDFKGHDFELIPFGAGRRGCPGITFAAATMEITLARLLHKFNWALPGGAEPESLDVTEAPGLAIHRKFPLVAVASTCIPQSL